MKAREFMTLSLDSLIPYSSYFMSLLLDALVFLALPMLVAWICSLCRVQASWFATRSRLFSEAVNIVGFMCRNCCASGEAALAVSNRSVPCDDESTAVNCHDPMAAVSAQASAASHMDLSLLSSQFNVIERDQQTAARDASGLQPSDVCEVLSLVLPHMQMCHKAASITETTRVVVATLRYDTSFPPDGHAIAKVDQSLPSDRCHSQRAKLAWLGVVLGRLHHEQVRAILTDLNVQYLFFDLLLEKVRLVYHIVFAVDSSDVSLPIDVVSSCRAIVHIFKVYKGVCFRLWHFGMRQTCESRRTRCRLPWVQYHTMLLMRWNI
jgi:hypothetical protein